MNCKYIVEEKDYKETEDRFLKWQSDSKSVAKFYKKLSPTQTAFIHRFQELAMNETGENREGTLTMYRLYFLEFTKKPRTVPKVSEDAIRLKYNIKNNEPTPFHAYICYITDHKPYFGERAFSERLPLILATNNSLAFLIVEMLIFVGCIANNIVDAYRRLYVSNILTSTDIIKLVIHFIIVLIIAPVLFSVTIAIKLKLKGYRK